MNFDRRTEAQNPGLCFQQPECSWLVEAARKPVRFRRSAKVAGDWPTRSVWTARFTAASVVQRMFPGLIQMFVAGGNCTGKR
jgi:hypothetical protein